MTRAGRSRLATGVVLILALGPMAAAVQAADRVYWANSGATDTISWANLDGSGGGDLHPTTATVSDPQGVTIDAAAGRIYWTNSGTDSISWSNLDGSADGNLNTAGAVLVNPEGAAIHPAAGRIYWGNINATKISFAKLDGSGGDNLNTAGTGGGVPDGIAIDPTAGRIYWAQDGGTGAHDDSIDTANLDGTGGFDLLIHSGIEPHDPFGLALDPIGIVYWPNTNGGAFSEIVWSGIGSGVGVGFGQPVNFPHGLAIDPAARRLYWLNMAGPNVQWASLDNNTDTGVVSTTGATKSTPGFPALLKAPTGTGAPAISGGPANGSTLSCSQGTWAPDELSSFLYQVPSSFAYQWSRDGADIPGATSNTVTADAGGDYRCRVTALNFAGSTSQTSAPQTVDAPPVPPPAEEPPGGSPPLGASPPLGVTPPANPVAPSNAFAFGKVKLDRKKGTARLAVNVPGPGTVTLTGKGLARVRPVAAKGRGTVSLVVKTAGKVKKKLGKTGTAKVKVTVTYTPTGGTAKSQTKTIKLKRKR